MQLETDFATDLVKRYVDPDLTVTAVRHLHGGMINHVYELVTEGSATGPASVVAKVNEAGKSGAFQRELEVLRFYRSETEMPVPRPYAAFEPTGELGMCGLLMERVPGVNLADARLSARGSSVLQRQLAQHVATLHSHKRGTYGSALESVGHEKWLDAFRPTMVREFEAVKNHLSTQTRRIIHQLLDHLDRWLPEQGRPTLVHGDLWSTNILCDDSHPDRPRITAFVDCGAAYCDAEYELAYLRIFRTASDEFFEEYGRHHPIAPGFDRRCRVYWLNTILLHIRLFGDQYLARAESLAQQIAKLSKR